MAMRAKIAKMQNMALRTKIRYDKAAHDVKKGDKSDINYINPPSTSYISNLEVPVGRAYRPPYKSDKNGNFKTNFHLPPMDIYVWGPHKKNHKKFSKMCKLRQFYSPC